MSAQPGRDFARARLARRAFVVQDTGDPDQHVAVVLRPITGLKDPNVAHAATGQLGDTLL